MAEKSHAPGRETILTHGGASREHLGIVNPPVYRASTILFPTLADQMASRRGDYAGLTYGLSGTPTTFALTDTLAALEGGAGTLVLSSASPPSPRASWGWSRPATTSW